MQENIFRKGIVVGLVALLVGTSVVTSIGKNIEKDIKENNPVNISSAPLDEGLVGYWSFDEGSGTIVHDSSGNDNDGTIFGGVQWVDGISGKALNFDGIDDYVNINDVSDFKFVNEDVTFTSWVQIVDNSNNYRNFVSLGDDSDAYPLIALVKSRSGNLDGRIYTEIYGNSPGNTSRVTSLQNGDTLPKNTWLFVVCVIDYPNSLKLYINATFQGSTAPVSFNMTSAVSLKLFIGQCVSVGWNGYHDRHKGLIDEIRIYNKELSIEEIQYLYNNPGGSENQPPVAKFVWRPWNPNPSQITNFDASESYDFGGTIISYDWDWNNDGTYDESHTSPTVAHSWTSTGSYPVKLKVTDNTGLNDTITKTVNVTSGNQRPDKPNIYGSNEVKLGDVSIYVGYALDPNDDKLSYFFDWGDGTNSGWTDFDEVLGSAAKTFEIIGVYNIKVKVKDTYGLESEWSNFLSVKVDYTSEIQSWGDSSKCWLEYHEKDSGGETIFIKCGASVSVKYDGLIWSDSLNQWLLCFSPMIYWSVNKEYGIFGIEDEHLYLHITNDSDCAPILSVPPARSGGVNVTLAPDPNPNPFEPIALDVAALVIDKILSLAGLGPFASITLIGAELCNVLADATANKPDVIWDTNNSNVKESAGFLHHYVVINADEPHPDGKWEITYHAGADIVFGWGVHWPIDLEYNYYHYPAYYLYGEGPIKISGPIPPAPNRGQLPDGMYIRVFCPVDVTVYPPSGFSVSKNISSFPNATYSEKDLDGDGDLDKEIYIPQAWEGGYKIYLEPQPGANPNETFSIVINIAGENITLVKDEKISNINISIPYLYQKPLPPWEVNLSGETIGKVGREYEYSFVATTPYNINVYEYCIDWGDGSTTLRNGSFASGEIVTVNHTWQKKGTYLVRLKVKDVYGLVSDWATLQVKIPRNRVFDNLILRFFEHHPLLFKMFQLLFKQLQI